MRSVTKPNPGLNQIQALSAHLTKKLTADAPAKKKTMPFRAKATVPCTAAAGGQPGPADGAWLPACHPKRQQGTERGPSSWAAAGHRGSRLCAGCCAGWRAHPARACAGRSPAQSGSMRCRTARTPPLRSRLWQGATQGRGGGGAQGAHAGVCRTWERGPTGQQARTAARKAARGIPLPPLLAATGAGAAAALCCWCPSPCLTPAGASWPCRTQGTLPPGWQPPPAGLGVAGSGGAEQHACNRGCGSTHAAKGSACKAACVEKDGLSAATKTTAGRTWYALLA